ncbi:MAG: PilZ domain-containing protein [Planctomycetota bacterium]
MSSPEPQPAPEGDPPASADIPVRGHNRVPWMRDDIELAVEHPGGTRVSLPAATFDIGRNGLGLTTQTFLHAGTITNIRLPGLDGNMVSTRGEVRWCSYQDGLHQCGIQFLDDVRLDRIVPRELWTEAMLEDDSLRLVGKLAHLFSSPLDEHMITLALRGTDISVKTADSPGSLLDVLRSGDIDVVVLDLRNEGLDLSGFHRQLEDIGFAGPLVFAADSDEEVMEASCVFGEPAATLKSPIDAAGISSRLSEVLQSWQSLSGGDDALFTSLRPDDTVATMLTNYHEACTTTAEALRSKLGRNDADGVVRLLRRIAGTAPTFGYAVVAKQADAAINRIEKAGSLRAAAPEIAQVRNLLRNLRGFRKNDQAA